MQKQRWSEIPTGAQVAMVLLGAVQLSLLAAALYDLRSRPAAQINGSKRLWTAAVFINWIGPLAYFFFGRRRA